MNVSMLDIELQLLNFCNEKGLCVAEYEAVHNSVKEALKYQLSKAKIPSVNSLEELP